MASECGRRIVEVACDDLKPSDILARNSIENALYVGNPLAGSTNAMIHLVAMSHRKPLSAGRSLRCARVT